MWRESSQSLYTKVGSTSLAAARRTSNLNVYRLDLEEPITFKEGDVIGLYLPRKRRSKFVVHFQPTVSKGVETSIGLSYRQTSRTTAVNLNNTQLSQDYDIPMVVIESGKEELADCQCDWATFK